MDRVILQFKDDLTVKMKNHLASLGFTHYARKVGEWIMFSKDADVKSPDCSAISACMEAILSSYHDPYGMMVSVRAECVDFAKKLSGEEKKFAFEWIEENIDNDLNGPPWEDENYQPNLGFC